MFTRCTCGSRLPGDASFCPNCGRPLRPGVGEAAEPREAPAFDESSSDPPPEELAWRGTVGLDEYLRAAFLPALCAMFLRFALGVMGPLLAALSYLIPCGAGYASVRLFEKRRAMLKSTTQGCYIGAWTGLLCFLPSLFLQLSILATHGKEAVLGPIRDQAETFPMATDVATMLEDPFVFAVTVTFGLAVEALLLVAASGIGGALAAGVSVREAR
jgi:hypothetical protein